MGRELSLLLDASLRAAVLGAGVFLVLKVARMRSAAVQHAAWTMFVAAMLLLPALTVLLPAIALPLLAPEPLAVAPPPVLFALRPVAAVRPVEAGIDWSRWAWFGYVAMAALLLVRLTLHWLRASRIVSGAARVEEARAACGYEVRETAAVAVPATAGLLRPVILLPAGWREWEDEMLRAALVHEAAHAARRDPLLLVLAAVNSALFWFHPLARWVEARLRRLCEEAADDQSLELLGDRARYASILVEMAEASLRRDKRLPWPAIAMARQSEVKHRIDRMLADGYRAGRPLARVGWLALVTVSAALLYPLATVRLAHAESTRHSKLRHELMARPYHKWLDEDVVYIITPEERTAFLKLTADEEREQFILQFWLRRDPTPDTKVNEFKQEHYRRIAYANERYGSTVPGWKTDRGQIYIVYGPPDEIESHPGDAAPWEVWRYRWIEGVGANVEFRFTAASRSSEYHLEPKLSLSVKGNHVTTRWHGTVTDTVSHNVIERNIIRTVPATSRRATPLLPGTSGK